MIEPASTPDIAEILLAAIGTVAITALGYVIRTRFPQLLSPPTKTVISELPKADNGDLRKQRDELSATLAQGVMRSVDIIERHLVQSLALNEQQQRRIDELEDREADNELIIAELKRRLENCE